jgi:hypothetical protein
VHSDTQSIGYQQHPGSVDGKITRDMNETEELAAKNEAARQRSVRARSGDPGLAHLAGVAMKSGGGKIPVRYVLERQGSNCTGRR